MSSAAAPKVRSSSPPGHIQEQRFAEARALHWAQGGVTVVILRGVLDRRLVAHISALTLHARRERTPLVVDLSGATRVTMDVLALLLDVHTDPGLSLVPPLPASFLTLAEMTGTGAVFIQQP